MGGFLLIKRDHYTNPAETETVFKDSIDVFNKKGLPLNKKIVKDDFVLYVFHKYKTKYNNILQFDNGDFIATTGTMLYNRKTGETALSELFKDFSVEDHGFFNKLLGNYCLIISKGNRLFLVNSPTGIYRSYCNRSQSVISTSFLAVYKTLEERALSPQEFYEYLFDGACYGNKTLIREIDLVDARSILQLSPFVAKIPQSQTYRTISPSTPFTQMVEEGAASLIDYYTIVKENFGNDVCAALTGGMDTRLMLACMRKVGIEPYLYIYGDREAPNVRIARAVAEGEGLQLDIEEKSKFPIIEKNEYPEFLSRQYYLLDGLGNNGIFNNGSDISTRLKRIERAYLQLNGVDGLLRFYYSIPNKAISIKSLLEAKHDGGDQSMCQTSHFKKETYFSNLAQKVRSVLDINGQRIERLQLETLVPYWRTRYWTGFNHMISNQLADTLCPGEDVRLNYLVKDIPYKYKYMDVYAAAVLTLIDPVLAGYHSQYGHGFSEYNQIPMKRKIKTFVTYHTPTAWRPYLRAHYWRQEMKEKFPYYLSQEYLDIIFLTSKLGISEYVDISRISEPYMLSRALSVELLLNGNL